MANPIPSYPKVLHLGAPYTHNALLGDVIIQEKIDGSQLRWGFDDKGEFHIGSKGREVHSGNQDGMFSMAFDYLTSFQADTKARKNCWFFGEYLQKPKHHCIKYDRVPKNNIVLFDALLISEWADRETLERFSWMWDIDLIPEVWRGNVLDECAANNTTPQIWLRELAESTNSYLGGSKVEGLVIKNYLQLLELHGRIRHLTTKYVRDEFREKHKSDNPSRREGIDDIIMALRSENRWEKAIQHLRDDGKLVNDVQDIGEIIKEVHRDLMEEEGEALKERIWDKYRKHVMSTAVRGLPDWYKDKLMEAQNGK